MSNQTAINNMKHYLNSKRRNFLSSNSGGHSSLVPTVSNAYAEPPGTDKQTDSLEKITISIIDRKT